ncbi:MAG: amidohydrolase family protein [Candidatus Helarchaeota archaeon]|nr:amidohydrolase family protein [Candidatus Helarchaeota archaeon]
MKKYRVIDFQTMMTTKKGASFPISAIKFIEKQFKHKIPYYQTEEEMIEAFNKANIKAILMPPTGGRTRFEKIREINDYVGKLISEYPDTILGAWVMTDLSNHPEEWLKEARRCITDLNFFGPWHYGAMTSIPATSPVLKPFYDLCIENEVPIKISVGATAVGAGLPGGGGFKLEYERPIPYIDNVAAENPELIVVCAHMPWPFHAEMASVLIHKGNVYNEVHGWRPIYFPEDYKKEINGRCKHKILFGSDWPILGFEQLYKDWESDNYKQEVLENIYYKNAKKLFLKLNINI